MFEDGKRAYNYHRETAPLWLTMWIWLRAGVVAMTITNPIWCIKVRSILYWNDKTQHMNGLRLFYEVAKEMYVKEGIRSYFRGLKQPSLNLRVKPLLLIIYLNLINFISL